uniref:Protein MON2 homolog n=1 Tax=Panagrolaimus sp. ES5 TaxID=591445 RepID=A0AC34GU34_9BILA
MSSSSGGTVAQDPQKFVDALLNDLRLLSTEARRKHESVKDAAETAIVKLRNISTTSDSKALHSNLQNGCNEILHPLILACSTKTPKLVQIALQAIQRALQFGIVNETSAPVIVRELSNLTEAECEELKVLQTITLFVSADSLVTGSALSKCIVIAIKLNFSKDPSVINAASAAVRQLFSCTFERVVQEDGIKSLPMIQFPLPSDIDINTVTHNNDTKMGVCAADSFQLLKDLMSLIRRQATSWLIGVKRFTMTLALELLESILKNYPSVFFRHIEHAVVLRDIICPQLLYILTGKKQSDSPVDKVYEKPPFPVLMRCLRIGLAMVKNYHEIIEYHAETFIQFVLQLLASRQAEWQSAAALEVLHKIVGQPELLRWLCTTFHFRPNGPKLVELIVRGITNYNCRALRKAFDDEPSESTDQNQPGFLCGEIFIPIHENVSAKRWILLDWLEKHEAGVIPLGYCISLAYACLIDVTHSIYAVVEEINSPSKQPATSQNEIELHQKVSTEVFQCAANSLLHGLAQLLVSSVEDSVMESLLNCLSTIVILACKVNNSEIKDASLRGLCRYSLPSGYYDRFINTNPAIASNAGQTHSVGDVLFLKDHLHTVDNIEMVGAKLDQVIAVGTVCPTSGSSGSAQNENFSLTAKNMKVARTLVLSADANGEHLTSTWDMILATLQHFTWIIGIKPLPNGDFRTDASGSESGGLTNINSVPSTVLTTAVVGELPPFNLMLNKLVEHSNKYDDVSLHHVIASLCELSSDQMKVAQKSSREISFFAIAKLLQTSIVNLYRLDVFWRPITAHLVEVCGHSHVQLREWGSIALTQLVMTAMRQHIQSKDKDTVCFIASNTLSNEVWEILIDITYQIGQDERSTERLIEYAYYGVSQTGKEFLEVLPFKCLKMYLNTVATFGKQSKSINISLSAIGLLWHVSDQIRIRCHHHGETNNQQIWLVLFECLGELCVDLRPAVRKSACDTLLQTVASHSDDLTPMSWQIMLSDILFSLLEKVRVFTKNASNERNDDSTSGNQKFLVHHSRDTPAKQWAETTVRTLFGVVRIFNAQRHVLKSEENFYENWSRMIQYIEYTAMINNPEMSLAALKDFYEFHFGKMEQKSSPRIARKVKANSTDRTQTFSEDTQASYSATQDVTDSTQSDREYGNANTVSGSFRMLEFAPSLPDVYWLVSWKSWLKIGKTLTTAKMFGTEETTGNRFIPSPFHWTTFLQIFPSLFHRVRYVIDVEDLRYNELLLILKKIASAPRSSDQTPFTLTTANPELSPTHEALFECIRILAKEMSHKETNHSDSLPDLFHLLLDFTKFSLRSPQTDFVMVKKDIPSPMQALSLVPFAELCLKFIIEFYTKVSSLEEVIDGEVLTSIIRGISDPLVIRYNCPTPSIWMNAATAFMAISRVGIPIARENLDKFKSFWLPFITIVDKFLFCKNRNKKPLNADERKRFEFVDCQFIELIRIEILPHATALPWEFMQKVIEILNKASIITLDPNDTLASDLCDQRTDLCKVSFDALLSLSQTQVPGEILDVVDNKKDGKLPQSLGAHAISSLLVRCKQVINGYARDEQNNGRLPLLSQRVFEVISVLRAISALIEGLTTQPGNVIESLYDKLVEIYPSVVQMVPCCKNSADVQLAVMITLNSYQTLLNLKNNQVQIVVT